MNNILITSAGRRVSLIRAFQKELKLLCNSGKVFTVDANPDFSSACRISDKAFKVPRLDSNDYIETLLDISLSNGVRMIIPTIDTELELLAKNKLRFEEKGVHVIISSAEFIESCRNKRLIHDFFSSKGIPIAKEYSLPNLSFPVFVKPNNGSRSVDTYLAREKKDIEPKHLSDRRFMFLEYIDHKENSEYTCDLYFGKDHELKCVVPRKRIEVRDGEVNKGITVKNSLVGFLKSRLNFIDGAVGCLTAQFFMNNENNDIVGIEINPRFGGGYPLSYEAGANFPKWLIEEYFQVKEISYSDDWESNLLMLRYDDEVLVRNHE